jgi:hypothetical protein
VKTDIEVMATPDLARNDSNRAWEQRADHRSLSHRRINHEIMGDTVTFRLATPTTQHEANVMAVKLFCVFAAILAGLIAGGVL